ncbi:hypothetical protein OUZ56_026163 [Daphnia magna]|uniref:Uncharacterized protein n=1 Tax=Daphnia magna TaxID=35525 RepID=A0ABQ9ZKY2_9CRUS|nr:hypothetical protein OUZ56_026163 [Daphnia magna]
MAKLDLQDAYLTVPVHATDQHYLQFIWGVYVLSLWLIFGTMGFHKAVEASCLLSSGARH